ncbi:hypothetical protein BLOT_003920 [Blomia tropicalis]|nr:hypothetical protein BLOT_003920 [Blomia tropicalis]
MSTGCAHNEDHSRSMDEYDWIMDKKTKIEKLEEKIKELKTMFAMFQSLFQEIKLENTIIIKAGKSYLDGQQSYLDCQQSYIDCQQSYLDCQQSYIDCQQSYLDCQQSFLGCQHIQSNFNEIVANHCHSICGKIMEYFLASTQVADAPARADILNCKRFNSKYGCNLCYVVSKYFWNQRKL